ncbi:MAG: glycosyltransferase [Myxococcales bacterium]|nr:glycosyltransferase [Myxococcota bacterium]MDW8282929.1 glycosyltransferase [Myxococcales bacterium]
MLTLLLLALGLVIYTYAGYPLLCALRARLRPRPLRPRGEGQVPVSVIIAAFRERASIEAKLASLGAQHYPPELLEVIVCCDGSDDGTQEVARRAGERYLPGRLRVLDLPRRGKPSALAAGVAAARGEVLVLTDARQPLSTGAIAALCRDLTDPEVGVVSGELVLEGDEGAGTYWRYEAWIRRNEARAGSVVGVSGALYALPRRLWRPPPPETILDDLWVPMQVRLEHGLRVVLEPEARAWDRAAPDAREFSRKARTLAGNFQLLWLMPALLSPLRNPSFFDFVSHKLCRLLVPYALLLMLLISVALCLSEDPPALITYLCAAQLLAYGAALLSLAGLGRGLRLVRLAGTFVVLNAAAVVGLVRLLRHGRHQPWT